MRGADVEGPSHRMACMHAPLRAPGAPHHSPPPRALPPRSELAEKEEALAAVSADKEALEAKHAELGYGGTAAGAWAVVPAGVGRASRSLGSSSCAEWRQGAFGAQREEAQLGMLGRWQGG